MVRWLRNNTHWDAAGGRNNTDGPACDSASFLQQSEALIPAEVRMISGCENEQSSADVLCGSTPGLPNPRGRAGGACTNAFLELLHQSTHKKMSFQQLLMQLRDKLNQKGHSQIPQLTSSRPLDLEETPFALIASPTGARRALLVGINYRGQEGELRGCHNDVYHMQDYLIQVQGFPPQDILVLMDDGKHHGPSREKIIRALRHLVAASQPGDAVFFHYSGHGGLLSPDFNSLKFKQSEYDQTLIPVDHAWSGQIRDFSLFHHFVQPMKTGVVVTCLMDCCHSGSVLDLPYSFRPTNTGGGSYVMSQHMSHMSNLAFLYLLAGGTLPYGVFDNVTEHLQSALGGSLGDYQGSMMEILNHDTAAADSEGNPGYVDADAGDLDDAGKDVGGTDIDTGDYDNVGSAADVRPHNINDDEDYYRDQFNDDQDYNDNAINELVDGEGCGDEGCGNLLAAFADCLNDR